MMELICVALFVLSLWFWCREATSSEERIENYCSTDFNGCVETHRRFWKYETLEHSPQAGKMYCPICEQYRAAPILSD